MANSAGVRLPRCWYTQYDDSPPTIRSCHQLVDSMSTRQAWEVFQSSRMSWSSKIIALGTVESSQRMSGSSHDSR